MTLATILIPARNEVAVIGRTLLHLSRGLNFADFEIIVIANGCTDATAAKARAIMPRATVIETARAGKCHALNLGYRRARPDLPVICLDADLDVTAEALMALLAPLLSGRAMAACGHMDVATQDASAPVRLFYRGWSRNPYFRRGKFGGVFALSPEAARRVFPLPEIIADDEYIRRSFAPAEATYVPQCRFTARAPSTLPSLVKVRRRSLRGAREITALGLSSPERGSSAAMLRNAAARPSLAWPILFFGIVMLWVRLGLALERKTATPRWERDLTTRVTG